MFLLVLILIIIFSCIFLRYWFKNRLKHKTETITCYTGGLGSGKTFLSVCKVRNLIFWCSIKENLKKLFRRPYREINVYSNIPLYLGKKRGYARILTKEHLLLKEKLDGLPIILIDEIGAFANQFEYNNPNIMQTFDEFIRFYRHYTLGGYIVCNDQCSENIILVVRRRINKIHNLSNFLKIGPIVLYFERMINISEEIKTIDNVETDKENNDTQNNMSLKFKIVFGIKNKYDTYCYSGRYKGVKLNKCEKHSKLKTNKVMTCPSKKEFWTSDTIKE